MLFIAQHTKQRHKVDRGTEKSLIYEVTRSQQWVAAYRNFFPSIVSPFQVYLLTSLINTSKLKHEHSAEITS